MWSMCRPRRGLGLAKMWLAWGHVSYACSQALRDATSCAGRACVLDMLRNQLQDLVVQVTPMLTDG